MQGGNGGSAGKELDRSYPLIYFVSVARIRYMYTSCQRQINVKTKTKAN